MFADMQIKIDTFTKTNKGFYSLSINPAVPLTRDQYFDYIGRAETSLGLVGHDRVVVFHIKESKRGELREHCHVVCSRADVQNARATSIAWDKYKLMAISREFARDYDLPLPKGYETGCAQAAQLSLYEKMQEQNNGLSREERKELIIDLWRTSDYAKAFVAALEDSGYILATGKRHYVLVDTFGNMNSLPKMIGDPSINTKQVHAFLEKDFPIEDLCSVDHARDMADQHNAERKRLALSERLAEQREIMKRTKKERADKLQDAIDAKRSEFQLEADPLQERHNDALYVKKLNNAQAKLEIDFRRAAHQPTGLAAFLSKVSGMDIMRRKLHEYQDRKRAALQDQRRQELEFGRHVEKLEQQREHEVQMIALRRQEHDQKNIFEREARSIEMAHQRDIRAHYSEGYEHMRPFSFL